MPNNRRGPRRKMRLRIEPEMDQKMDLGSPNHADDDNDYFMHGPEAPGRSLEEPWWSKGYRKV